MMLTLICGLPRAGKTTYSKQFEDGCQVVHFDKCQNRVKGHIRCLSKVNTDRDIVVEGVYDLAFQRKELREAYLGDKTRCIWLNTPMEIKKTRPGYCKACEYKFEPPTYAEGWDEIEVING